MAALLAILAALRKAIARDLSSFESLKVNNFFLFVLLLIAGTSSVGLPPTSAYPFLLVLSVLILFPMSTDPLAKIPPDRLALWPLSMRQRIALRVTSFLLSPLLWIMALILWRSASLVTMLSYLALALGVQIASATGQKLAGRQPHFQLLRYVPQVPGPLGGLIRKNLRQQLSLLDPYLALVLSIGGGIYRFTSPNVDPAAPVILGLLVALALSTYTQSLFGLDGAAGMTRYRLLPLRGWQILLAKDVAFLVLLIVLVVPLSPLPGITFGLAALAFGHHSSVFLRIPQRRWRFAGGRLLPVGALQAIGGISLGFAESNFGPIVLVWTLLGFGASLFWYGRCWDHSRSGPS
ncbi:MAG: hypothetical protein ABI823_05960 [Bryobacteraceae bacterium]